jgi:hypothetical protein
MKPFLHGRKSLTVPALHVAPGPAGVPPRSCASSRTPVAGTDGVPSASVEVVKEGDRIARLVVTCACGEKIEIDCIYPVGA